MHDDLLQLFADFLIDSDILNTVLSHSFSLSGRAHSAARNLYHGIDLTLVSLTDLTEPVKYKTAFEAGTHFFDIVLEALERGDRAIENLLSVPGDSCL